MAVLPSTTSSCLQARCRTCETAERVCLTFITDAVVHWLCLRCGEKWEAERLTAEHVRG